jgi:hypothetical protein
MAVGWGWTRWAANAGTATTLDLLCLAPAVGAGIIIVAAFVVAAIGANPAGWLGVALLIALAAGGAWLAMRPTGDATSRADAPGGAERSQAPEPA